MWPTRSRSARRLSRPDDVDPGQRGTRRRSGRSSQRRRAGEQLPDDDRRASWRRRSPCTRSTRPRSPSAASPAPETARPVRTTACVARTASITAGSTLEFPAARSPPKRTGPISPAVIQSIVAHQDAAESCTPTNAKTAHRPRAGERHGRDPNEQDRCNRRRQRSVAAGARHRRRQPLEAEAEQRREREHGEVRPDEVGGDRFGRRARGARTPRR